MEIIMFKFNVEGLLEVLPKAGQGWLGVFTVTIVIIAAVWLLDKLTRTDS